MTDNSIKDFSMLAADTAGKFSAREEALFSLDNSSDFADAFASAMSGYSAPPVAPAPAKDKVVQTHGMGYGGAAG